jgi:hypothetical protein
VATYRGAFRVCGACSNIDNFIPHPFIADDTDRCHVADGTHLVSCLFTSLNTLKSSDRDKTIKSFTNVNSAVG